MERDFNIGDVVKIDDESELWIVLDYVDYSSTDIEYELMRIIPVRKNEEYTVCQQEDLSFHTKYNSKPYELLIDFINKERGRLGLFDEPQFIEIVRNNLKASKELKSVRTEDSFIVLKLDDANYNMVKTIDECLDMINDLNMLYEAFKDEKYLEHKEMVFEQIKKLQNK